ncbi:dynein axonemal heavy chain 2 isoform 7-T7 [Synchiropus picturatus]
MDKDHLKSTRGLFIRCASIPGVTEESWSGENERALEQFVCDESITTLVVYLDVHMKPRVEFTIPVQVAEHLVYFIREPGAIITPETFEAAVQFGTVRGDPTHSLLRFMASLHAPLVSLSAHWEKNIKNNYVNDLHCYLAALTDEVHQKEGQTVLYVPTEGLQFSPEEAVKDKKLLQRMETVVIHWTDQIKDFLNRQEVMKMRDGGGPLQEISFWKSRSAMLSDISLQLQKPGVQHILSILQLARSLYVQRFSKMTSQITDFEDEARSNLSYLSILMEPCEELQRLELNQVAPKLRHIVNLIRIIWVNSAHYNTSESVTGLFCKVSNEVIRLCIRSISLDKIFGGFVTSSKRSLHQCMDCCLAWKDIYQEVAETHQRLSTKPWDLDQNSIFVLVDIHLERFRDLLEVCDCQQQFARWEDGQQRAPPCFSGCQGPEFSRSLLDLEDKFHHYLRNLQSVGKEILDVESVRWCTEFNRFLLVVKDLEMVMQNLMDSVFKTVSTVEEGVRLLDVFRPLCSREGMKRTMEEKAEEVYSIFSKELATIHRELNQRTSSVPEHMPLRAGHAHWARGFRSHLESRMEVLKKAPFLPESFSQKQVFTTYSQMVHLLDELVRKEFSEWSQNLDRLHVKKLEQPLMLRSKDKVPRLDITFDSHLSSLLAEIHYWDRLNFEIPQCVSEVYWDREEIRGLKEQVLLLARDYNRIFTLLSSDELTLFRERIRHLDKQIQPGLTRLTWLTKESSGAFVRDCLLHIHRVQLTVDWFKASVQTISGLCRRLSETLLLRLDGKTMYRNLDFEEDQKTHQLSQVQSLRSAHQEVVEIMSHIHETFCNDGPEVGTRRSVSGGSRSGIKRGALCVFQVQEQWVSFTEKVDHMVEEAVRTNVLRSMQRLSVAISGEGKTLPNPLFKVQVTLRQSPAHNSPKVEFSPAPEKLAHVVNLLPQLIHSVSGFRRLPELLGGGRSQRSPVHIRIEQDEEIRRIQTAVSAGMSAACSDMKDYLETWSKYRNIWMINKDSFIQRYQRFNQPVTTFVSDIHRYTENANSVEQEETLVNIRFITLDTSPIKSSLVQHCNEWQFKFTQLLGDMASARLRELHAAMRAHAERLREAPNLLEELSQNMKLLESLQGDLGKTEHQISVVHEQFAVLDKYEVPLEPSLQELREALPREWLWFQQVLADSDVALKKHKEKFKSSIVLSSEELKKQIQTCVQEFHSSGPFSSLLSPDSALTQITGHRGQLETLKQEENRILSSLSFFKIEQPASKSLCTLEKDLDSLQQVWEATREWSRHWDRWKLRPFTELQTETMERTAQDLFHKLRHLKEELKDKRWDILDSSKNKVDHFKRLVPLLVDLKNLAMRDRHWKQICDKLQCSFDQTSPDFTLEKIISLGLDKSADKISEISEAATKEVSIEQGLEEISKTWEETSLDVAPYKDGGHYHLRGSEEVVQALEDIQVVLSTMRGSCFVKAFEHEVERRERQLSHAMEVVEMFLTVQRHWMYLENIFQGKDIQEQLPRECEQFEDVSSSWRAVMEQLRQENNALRGTHQPGLPAKLSEMSVRLEEIQKALDQYLEAKRQIFPRFYFLSSMDLLEVLGQSQNPEAMQPHLKKCFSNIRSLHMKKVGLKNEVTSMASADGEMVEFIQSVQQDKAVELWLCDVESTMRRTLKTSLKDCLDALKMMKGKREKWLNDWPGQVGCLSGAPLFCDEDVHSWSGPLQVLITASQIQWTSEVTQALLNCKEFGNKSSLKSLKEKQVSMLKRYSEMVRGDLSSVLRLKIAALVTVEVHARDVIDQLARVSCKDANAFEWLSQLRLYWEKDLDDCTVRQTHTQFRYGYEYQGNSGRLAVTPLTDRCYVTLTTALHLHRGGSLTGPAGTGKTETVKDLGKALGMHVVVVNCSEGLDYRAMAGLFSGLAQTGAWGCFDDFQRIKVEVLSVVAQQVLSVLSALSSRLEQLQFGGRLIRLVGSCGVFITVKPGCAAHADLPDDLKSMFRPVAMLMPDSTLIAEVTLLAEGFKDCKTLAKKVSTLHSLALQLLSRQDHYDFGLRALGCLLRHAGRKRRACPDVSDEEEILLVAVKDMHLAQLTSADLPVFTGLLQDLFPSVDAPATAHRELEEAVEAELRHSGYQATSFSISKVLQLYETKTCRHACMLVGETGSGKTVTWSTLQRALCSLHQRGVPGYQQVQHFPLNPKSMSLGELYGENKRDGVLSSIMRSTCADEGPEEKWIVLDGPVDPLWVERMDSVMDDNKVLTLLSGERISVPGQVSLLFEVENLAAASPATVSRCGMVYHDNALLGWRPLVDSWLDKRHENEVAHLRRLFDKFLSRTLEFKRRNCREPTPVSELSAVSSLCRLYDSLASRSNEEVASGPESVGCMIELWFTFSLIWSVCASVDGDGRKRMDSFLRELDGTFPIKDTVYEYYADTKSRTWTSFEEQLPKSWRYSVSAPFYKIMVPTVDTVRYRFLVKSLVLAQYPVLLTGPVGTGKTLVAQSVLQELESSEWSSLTVNMSSQTSSNNIRAVVESRLEKRTKGVFVPAGGKPLLCFLDDLNVPAKDAFGSRPPLELLRLWLDHGFWYDLQRRTPKLVKDMRLLASMGPPGGGRTLISSRLQSRFNLINVTPPHDSQIRRIYSTMIHQKLQGFKEDVKPIGEVLVQATLELFQSVSACFWPTPTKTHYLFNLRDVSKVFQGLLRAHPDFHDTKSNLARLWTHECFRVFSDRLVDRSDAEAFVALLTEKLASQFDLTFHSICPSKQPPVFGDFLSEPWVYEDLGDSQGLKEFLERQLQEYNEVPGVVPMSLVLFRHAIDHIARVLRVIRQPRGHMLLVGVGGSGRQSLSKLAAFVCNYQVYQVEATKQEFRDDLKKLYRQTGVDHRATVLLLGEMADPSFLEEVHNLMSGGDVPNLFTTDEFVEIYSSLSAAARRDNVPETPHSLFRYLMERVRSNLHVVLCLSPGESFRSRLLQFPALLNSTTIDWFCEWPEEALLEVAERRLEGLDVGAAEKAKVASACVSVHRSATLLSQKMTAELRRHSYVRPTNYLDLVSGYKKLLADKRHELELQVNKLQTGLLKVSATREKVEVMSAELEEARRQVAEVQLECDKYLSAIVQQKMEADKQQKAVRADAEKVQAEEHQCQVLADLAQRDLDQALPALDEAKKALESLNKTDMTEIKSYGRPPAMVETVMQAVMTLLEKEATWTEAKRQLGDASFIRTLVTFDKDNISDKVMKKVGSYCRSSDFDPEKIGNVSLAARSLCMWVRAIEAYGNVHRSVKPKRAQFNAAAAQLAEKQAELSQSQKALQKLGDELEQLKQKHGDKLSQKDSLRKRSEEMEVKLDRADKLVKGLAGERVRWEDRVAGLEEELGFLLGDCLLAASFLSYMGPLRSRYRDELLSTWMKEMQGLGLRLSPGFTFADFLSEPAAVREWNAQGLPSDTFSTENGLIVTRGSRWPLMVDPQGQAVRWIKRMEMSRGLKVVDPQVPDYLGVLQDAIQFGNPVLLQNVQEQLDPSLWPLLNKSLTRIGGRLLLRLAGKDVEFHPEFRFYIATNLSNPHYAPETSSRTTIVNFAVKEQGLEAQLLGVVVRKERPELEEQKDSLVISISSGQRNLQQLEDQILGLLKEASGSLLDEEQLVQTLQTSKVTASEVSEQLESSLRTAKEIDSAREEYRSCARRASMLFFLLSDLSLLDPMYQFSLDAYIQVFVQSVEKSGRSQKLEERLANLISFHTYAVYRFVSRTLFQCHKLLFSFQMCVRILEASGKLNMEEYNFFLGGGQVRRSVAAENLTKTSSCGSSPQVLDGQVDNPCSDWLPDSSWDHICALDKLPNFHGLVTSLELDRREWHVWFSGAEPESTPLPAAWENKCSHLQKMLIVRCLRQDRVSSCVASFVTNTLGARFVEPPVLDLKAVSVCEGLFLERTMTESLGAPQVAVESCSSSPLLFILSPGADPAGPLQQLAELSGMSGRFHTLSLGQGQAPVAGRLLEDAVRNGHWLFLANCHLLLSWMPQLDRVVEQLEVQEPHSDFRLWLSSSPHPEFPVRLLQASVKMSWEPPKVTPPPPLTRPPSQRRSSDAVLCLQGVKANLRCLYQQLPQAELARCSRSNVYRKLLFSLSFFHSVLLERSQILQLGWNRSYRFSPADFEVGRSLLGLYLDQHEEAPWEALRLLVAGVTYGGHVTEEWDRRLLDTYTAECFCDDVVQQPLYKLSPSHHAPRDGPPSSYLDHISTLPPAESPEVLGQHPNAQLGGRMAESRALLSSLTSLQLLCGDRHTPAGSRAGSRTERELKVLELLPELRAAIPSAVTEHDSSVLQGQRGPLEVVLLQEIQRYNQLLETVRWSLEQLEKGITGVEVMSPGLEEIFNCVHDGKVPPLWGKTYPSLKPLAAWTSDLRQRVEQLARWAQTSRPPALLWLSGFTSPKALLTAVLQSHARQHQQKPVDSLSWEFTVSTVDDSHLLHPPQDGVLVRGLFLQGAAWDRKNSCLVEAQPMQMFCPMPSVHFKPSDNRKKTPRSVYVCPCFSSPQRSGSAAADLFVAAVYLKSGALTPDHWVKRGTALVLSLDH